MPATAAAPVPIVSNQVIAARFTIHRTGRAAAAPMRTRCSSRAAPIMAWRAVANCARWSPRTGGWAGPTAPGPPKSTMPITLTNSFAETRIRLMVNLNCDDRRSLECDGRRGRPPLPLRRLRAGADLAGMARSHRADDPGDAVAVGCSDQARALLLRLDRQPRPSLTPAARRPTRARRRRIVFHCGDPTVRTHPCRPAARAPNRRDHGSLHLLRVGGRWAVNPPADETCYGHERLADPGAIGRRSRHGPTATAQSETPRRTALAGGTLARCRRIGTSPSSTIGPRATTMAGGVASITRSPSAPPALLWRSSQHPTACSIWAAAPVIYCANWQAATPTPNSLSESMPHPRWCRRPMPL